MIVTTAKLEPTHVEQSEKLPCFLLFSLTFWEGIKAFVAGPEDHAVGGQN